MFQKRQETAFSIKLIIPLLPCKSLFRDPRDPYHHVGPKWGPILIKGI